MDDGITVTVPGARDIIDELRGFKEEVRYKLVRRFVREAGQYILRALEAKVPVLSGKLKRNLSVITRWKSRSGILQAKIRVSTKGKADDPKNAFYWRFLHRGFHPGGGEKFVEPDTFIIETNREVQQPVTAMFYRGIEQALSKLGKKRA